jgi:hypothetical protein
MHRKKWLIVSLIGISLVSALFDGLFYLRGVPWTPASAALAGVLSPLLLALWVDVDSKDRRQVKRSFDYGFLVLIFLLPYLPYYLWRTRGAAGLLICAGFLGLSLMGFLVQLLIYCLYSL